MFAYADELSGWNFGEWEETNILTNKIKQNDNQIHFIPKGQSRPNGSNKERGKSAVPYKRR